MFAPTLLGTRELAQTLLLKRKQLGGYDMGWMHCSVPQEAIPCRAPQLLNLLLTPCPGPGHHLLFGLLLQHQSWQKLLRRLLPRRLAPASPGCSEGTRAA